MQSRMVVYQKHKQLTLIQCSFIEMSFKFAKPGWIFLSSLGIGFHHILPHGENSYRLFIICGPSPHFWSHPVLGSWQLKAEAGSYFSRKESDFKGELPNSLNSQGVITCMFGVANTHLVFLHNPDCRLQAPMNQHESPGSFD